MSKVIDLSKTVYQLYKEDPEVIEIMKEIGFESISDPAKLNTVGRFVTIPKGAEMKGIEIEKIKDEFIKRGYSVKM
ncbi:DUF1858 domain-containing protein [Clostridium magnum]|uniref:DUF1858 domain-containing protein n=1 Tax=Clostridium magnum DSM 2767 TaxID=1121326 RepID=A0A161Y3W6_9CLOT|nr:DUF1858 domain-containing protein [Clostridium magnum]KZL92779.1 hypothetical protein CLMAG_25930 [Clostridium magnum DSM 2767]SHJ40894.1 protein of unknown function [Clostridium magnum DSM 2767]